MNLLQHCLRPVAHVAGLRARSLLHRFLAAHEDTASVQVNVLADLISAHKDTAFGHDHGFARVSNYEDFRSAVPIQTYHSLQPYIHRVLHGQTEALLPPGENVEMFSMTSGTTGMPKHIPVTRRFAHAMKEGFTLFGYPAIMDHQDVWLRPILQISSPMQETVSPTGLPCGAISGLLAKEQKPIVRRMYVIPQAVTQITDPVSKYYTTLRCGIDKDVSFITTANPSSTIKLIETGQHHTEQLLRDIAEGTLTPPTEVDPLLLASMRFRPNPKLASHLESCIARDGELLPHHFWNVAFLANWTGGTLKLYLPRLRELFGDVPIRDIGLIASEGRFSIPLADGTPAGAADILHNFLEFIPADQAGHPNPDTLLAHELEVGQRYVLVVTNWASLWRYNMDDHIRVVDKIGQSPVFEFLSRGQSTANITGEKLTEHQVVTAMQVADSRLGLKVDRFVMQGRFNRIPHYELRVELQPGMDPEELAQVVDQTLGELNIEYAAKRKSHRLGPITPVVLAPGTLARADAAEIAARKGRSEQFKPQFLLTEVLEPDGTIHATG
jgi:hypothetical protein